MNADELTALTRVRSLAASGAARTIRCRAGVSLAEVASGCTVTATTVWRWETGQRVPHGAPAIIYGEILAALAAEVPA